MYKIIYLLTEIYFIAVTSVILIKEEQTFPLKNLITYWFNKYIKKV